MKLFGLTITPPNFQGYINKILTKKLIVVDIVYLDNGLIYIKDLSQDYIKIVR